MMFHPKYEPMVAQEHHIGGSPIAAIVMEPGSSGRWYEKDEDGSECDWGTVLHWDPRLESCSLGT